MNEFLKAFTHSGFTIKSYSRTLIILHIDLYHHIIFKLFKLTQMGNFSNIWNRAVQTFFFSVDRIHNILVGFEGDKIFYATDFLPRPSI